MNTQEFCEKYLNDVDYTINPDGTIDVNGSVNLWQKLGNMTKLPVKFGKVSGYFDCDKNKLTTLEYCPKHVGGYFDCRWNKLTTLEHSPKFVGGYFSCYRNNLTTLKGIEKCQVVGGFDCGFNDITPENYKYILTAKIGGEISTDNIYINDVLNKYKNDVKYLHKALLELKKTVNFTVAGWPKYIGGEGLNDIFTRKKYPH
jgi:hypothetical protein